MVVIEIQVHAGRQAPGLKPKKVPAGRKGDAISTPDLAWSPREGASGESHPQVRPLPQISHPQHLCAWLLLCFICLFPCFGLGAPGGRGGLFLTGLPTRGGPATGQKVSPAERGGQRGRRGGSVAQAEAGEGGVRGERDVTEPTGAIGRVVGVLPVGLEGRRARRVAAIQVGIQDLQNLLVHSRLELPGEEGGSGDLLERERQRG